MSSKKLNVTDKTGFVTYVTEICKSEHISWRPYAILSGDVLVFGIAKIAFSQSRPSLKSLIRKYCLDGAPDRLHSDLLELIFEILGFSAEYSDLCVEVFSVGQCCSQCVQYI